MKIQIYPTLAESKRHWRDYTSKVVSDHVKDEINKHGTTWEIMENGQSVMSIPRTSLRFYFNFTNSQIPSIVCSTTKN